MDRLKKFKEQWTTVEKRTGLSYREFREEYVRPRRPVILTDAATRAGWPALQKWSPDYLKEKIGAKMVEVRGGKYHVISESQQYRFSDYLDACLASTPDNPVPYMYGVPIPEELPELMEDFSDMPFYFPDRLRSSFAPPRWRVRHGLLTFLVGGNGARFPELHFDRDHMDVFVTQVCGEKEFIVISPDQTQFVYQDKQYFTKSAIEDVENPDFEQYPLFENVRPAHALVKPGETIYVPDGWWHTTKVANFSVGISMNTVNALNWAKFTADTCRVRANSSALKRNLRKLHMKVGGMCLTVAETLRSP